ncbi:hypothetical protein Taro_044767, partial [Colocasia esculenta]|nr:hypothetical protein [Colocasia esculenta]
MGAADIYPLFYISTHRRQTRTEISASVGKRGGGARGRRERGGAAEPAQIVRGRGREQKPMAIATAPFSYRSPSLLLLLCLLLSEGIGRSDSMLGYAKLQMWPSCVLESTENIDFRRMIVQDADIEVLVKARDHMLIGLKLDKCSGFSTDALRLLARSC